MNNYLISPNLKAMENKVNLNKYGRYDSIYFFAVDERKH